MNTDQKRTLKRPGRKRRTLGWTLLTLGLLVAGVWVASGRWLFSKNWTNQRVTVMYGLIEWTTGGPYPDSWVCQSLPQHWDRGWKWWWSWGTDDFGFSKRGVYMQMLYPAGGLSRSSASLLLWPIPLLLWTPAALLLRSGILARRRAITGMCKKCGYDLAGLADDSPCPECGKTKTKA